MVVVGITAISVVVRAERVVVASPPTLVVGVVIEVERVVVVGITAVCDHVKVVVWSVCWQVQVSEQRLCNSN